MLSLGPPADPDATRARKKPLVPSGNVVLTYRQFTNFTTVPLFGIFQSFRRFQVPSRSKKYKICFWTLHIDLSDSVLFCSVLSILCPRCHQVSVCAFCVCMHAATYYFERNITAEHRLTARHPVITATLFWPKQKLSQSFSYLKNPFNTTTPLLRPAFFGP